MVRPVMELWCRTARPDWVSESEASNGRSEQHLQASKPATTGQNVMGHCPRPESLVLLLQPRSKLH